LRYLQFSLITPKTSFSLEECPFSGNFPDFCATPSAANRRWLLSYALIAELFWTKPIENVNQTGALLYYECNKIRSREAELNGMALQVLRNPVFDYSTSKVSYFRIF
jgi:hypothetical protein